MSKKSCFTQIVDQNSDDVYFLFTHIFEKKLIPVNFSLILFRNECQWSGVVNNESLNAMAEEAKMNSSEFSQLTAKALMRKVDSERFCYEISSTDTGKTLQLVWMEKDKKAGVNFILGKVELYLVTAATEAGLNLSDLLGHNCLEMVKTAKHIEILEEENLQLTEDRSHAIEFASVLNSKKQRIRELIAEIESLKSDGYSINFNDDKNKDEEDSDPNTDEEKSFSGNRKRQDSSEMHEADASKVNQIIMGVREISNEDMELFQTQKTTANEKETDDLFRPKKRRQQKSETSESIATSSISGKRNSPMTSSLPSQSLRKKGPSQNSSDLLRDVE